ncbi:MAG TPA: lipoprotein insertase outer membrane protein LolB [Rhodocyclaceae bacterium]
MPAPGPRPARAEIPAFSLDGRVSAHREDVRHYANISWRHAGGLDDIVLTTPLGQGVAELTRDEGGASLKSADGKVVSAADWEDLSARVFGFALPLEGMPRWLLGDVEATQRDEQGRPLAAEADGWSIRYLGYESDAADALPTLVDFRRDDIDVRLKVDSWQLN